MPSTSAVLLGAAVVFLASGDPQMMSDDTFSGPAPLSEFTMESFGPLKDLIGTWEGKLGLNVIRLPQVTGPDSGLGDRTASFTTIIQEYMETVTFTPIMGAILNRGYQDANQFDPPKMLNQTLLGLLYLQEVRHLDKDGVKGQLIHAENGQWLFQATPGIFSDWSVARFAFIPHSPGIIAVGPTRTLGSGEEVLQAMDEAFDTFDSTPRNLGDPPFLGYGALIGNPQQPLNKLKEDIGPDFASMKAVELTVTTADGEGTVAMLRNPRAQVFNEAFDAKFWVQTVTDSYGSVKYQQLQYAQTVRMNFLAKFSGNCESRAASSNPGCVIQWPHTQVNTLRKVPVGLQDLHDADTRLPYIR